MEYEKVSFDDCWLFVRQLEKEHAEHAFTGVYALPRGGLVLGVMLSHALGIPLLAAPCKGCLVVDDIADTGISLKHYRESGYYIATMYYHPNSMVVPNYYMKLKKDAWILFPWEAEGEEGK